MIVQYKCPTCGYDHAVWHISLDISRLNLCENCLPRFMNPNARINGYELNRQKRWHVVVPEFVRRNMQKLQDQRIELGFSRDTLSRLVGVCGLDRYEQGTALPSRKQYNLLAEFFEWEEWT
ncbi:MAG: helix-turn-helix transcriptional regulator [Synergistaceae bacterium]|nr:helix-turn-helix transcriptional regulator [Synergistaceae bacterium]